MEISASKALVSVQNTRVQPIPIEPTRINGAKHNHIDRQLKPFGNPTATMTKGPYHTGKDFTAFAVKGSIIDVYV